MENVIRVEEAVIILVTVMPQHMCEVMNLTKATKKFERIAAIKQRHADPKQSDSANKQDDIRTYNLPDR